MRRADYRLYMKLFKDKKIRNDVILVAVILVVACAVWLVTELSKEEGAYAVVVVNGEETARYPLNRDAEICLESENGGYNILVIKDGTADVVEASCPDKICVNQHSIDRTGETITCLPNKTVIKIVGAGEAEIDFVS